MADKQGVRSVIRYAVYCPNSVRRLKVVAGMFQKDETVPLGEVSQ